MYKQLGRPIWWNDSSKCEFTNLSKEYHQAQIENKCFKYFV